MVILQVDCFVNLSLCYSMQLAQPLLTEQRPSVLDTFVVELMSNGALLFSNRRWLYTNVYEWLCISNLLHSAFSE